MSATASPAAALPAPSFLSRPSSRRPKYGYDGALRAFDGSLRRLRLAYLDLFLFHWPVPAHFEATVQSWKAFERLLAEGRVHAIGVANFTPAHLKILLERCDITPAVADARLGIVTQAWSPIGGSARRVGDPLTDPTLVRLAEKFAKTPAQIVLRWHLQQGRSAIPKSFKPGRIAENFDIFDFALAAADLAAIDAMDTGQRSGADPEIMDASRLPATIED